MKPLALNEDLCELIKFSPACASCDKQRATQIAGCTIPAPPTGPNYLLGGGLRT